MLKRSGTKMKDESPQQWFDPMKGITWHWWEYPEIYWFRYMVRPIEDFLRKVKFFIQRGKRKYADEDLWNFDGFLAEVILAGLIWFRKEGHCVPLTEGPDGKLDYDEKRWNEILDRMIEGFSILKKCSIGEDLEWGGNLDEEHRVSLNSILLKNNIRVTTKEEEQKVSEAFDLFKKYFWNLSD